MNWNRKFVVNSLAAILIAAAGAAACGDDAGSNNGTANNGANNDANNGNNNGQPLDHPNVECSEVDEGTLCNITGEITQDLALANDGTIWQLDGPVFVGDDTDETVLTIEPGVTVYANPAADPLTLLAVRRGSKIEAEGTATDPIVFTPAADGDRQRGMWGGLIINGRAPLNSGFEASGEGSTGNYGGDEPTDNSGTLKYVRVEFAGYPITADNELNGIAFQGVGSGTTVDYVQVHMNADDGVEFFGGTVDAKHLVLTGIGDDSLDWTEGWTGNAQFIVAEQYDDKGGNGIEADNLSSSPDATPRSQPTLSNLTFIGGENGGNGFLLRAGTAANIYNAIVVDFAESCLNIDEEATFNNAWSGDDFTGELTLINSLVFGCDPSFADDEEDPAPFTVQEWFEAAEGDEANEEADPMLDGYVPQSGSPALSDAVIPEGDFFENVDYIGAVGDEDWTAGWTISAQN